MPSIASLPNELISLVLADLRSQRDVASLCRTNRKLHEAVNPILYKNAVKRRDVWPLAFAAFSGRASTMRRILAAGADPTWVFNPAELPREACALLTSNPDRVTEPRNTHFGRTETYLPQYNADDRWSPMSSDLSDLYGDAFEADGAAVGPDMGLWDSWTGTSDLGGIDGFYASSEEEDELDDEMSEHSSLDDTDADSSTLGYSDRQRDDPIRGSGSPNQRCFTALHIAAGMGNNEVVEVLLDHGALINAPSHSLCGCKRAAGMLNNIESPEPDSTLPMWTPLHAAICHNHPATAMLLLSRGAICMMEALATGTREQYDSTALHHAAALGQVDLVKYLVENGHQTDLNVQDRRSLTPFYYAYANSRWDSTIPLLLQMGANINPEIKFYQPYCTITPLGEAVRLGNFDDAQKLIGLGADPSHGFVATGAGHRKGLSPLHLGCMPSARRSGGIRFLEEADKAAQRRNIMETFIAKGSDVHSTDCYGDTALLSAAQNRVSPSLKALIAAGADVNAKNSLGRTVAMQAVLGPPNPLPNSLDGHHSRSAETLRVLPGILGELLKAGARIEDVDPNGNNILHLLFDNSSFDSAFTVAVLHLLLSCPGADKLLSTRNKEGQLAFEVAFNAGAIEACDKLLRRGSVQRALTGDDLERMFRSAMLKPSTAPRYLNLLLDLDSDHVLLSSTALFSEAITNGNWLAASAISRCGIPRLDQVSNTQLLRRALDASQWELAYELIEQGADVNAVGGDGSEPLLKLVINQLHIRDSYRLERMVQILLDRGANIHYSPCGTADSRPLNQAIRKWATSLVQLMLRDQPLREDPRAVGGYYLHHALLVDSPGHEKRLPVPKIVYALLRSGADLTELDQNGNYPLTVLLRGLCALGAEAPAHDFQFVQYSPMLQDLFVPGVQITRPNNEGRSIVGYLEELLKTKAGRASVAPKLELVEGVGGAKVLRFHSDMKLKKMPEDYPETTIWDSRLDCMVTRGLIA